MPSQENEIQAEQPADIKELRNKIGLLNGYSNIEVEHLYKTYCRSVCAGWLMLSDEIIASFYKWLKE